MKTAPPIEPELPEAAALSPIEQERRSALTAILAAAEILRDFSRELAGRERARFIQAIVDESARLQRSFEAAS
jgi:K+-sensing histidine kinase KdpD